MRILFVLVMALFASSCAQMQMLIIPSPIWSELSSAAEGRRAVSALKGEVALRTAWKEPGKRIYVLATDAKGEHVVYAISRKELPPLSAPVNHNCVIRQDGMQCGDQMLQTTSGSLWEDVAAHAREQLPILRAEREAAIRKEIAMAESGLAVTRRKYDLARERHPFEWGGKYETIENAQDFLEAATEKGMAFISDVPSPPQLNIRTIESSWQVNNAVRIRTMGYCLSLLQSNGREAIYKTSTGISAPAASVWRWQQGVDWSRVNAGSPPTDFYNSPYVLRAGVYFSGVYEGSYQGERAELIGFHSRKSYAPGKNTHWGNAFRIWLDPAAPAFLVYKEVGGVTGVSSERLRYAVTFLSTMCKKR